MITKIYLMNAFPNESDILLILLLVSFIRYHSNNMKES